MMRSVASGRVLPLLAIAIILPAGLPAPAVALAEPVTVASAAPAATGLVDLPLHFEPNVGQSRDEDARYLANGPGYLVHLLDRGAGFLFGAGSDDPRVVVMEFVGGARSPAIAGVDELPGKSHYLRAGGDFHAQHYARVAYDEVWPGIDAVFYGAPGRALEYDFLVAPGADAGAIRLAFQGADALRVDDAGRLVLALGARDVAFRAPFSYQTIEGIRHAVDSHFVLERDGGVGFALGAYDASLPLVIDPVLDYSTFVGGTENDFALALALDGQGNAYVTGSTGSSDFDTTPGAADLTFVNGEAFVFKLNATGTGLLYSTFIGGSSSDGGQGIAVDAAGRAYVVGATASSDLPVAAAIPGFDKTYNGGAIDAFVAVLSADGSSFLYLTFFGGSDSESGLDIALGPDGGVHIVGNTASTNLPTKNATFPTYAGAPPFAGFAAKFDTTVTGAASLGFSTFLPGSPAVSVDVDAQNRPVIGANTDEPDFPVLHALFPTANGNSEALILKLTADGSSLVFATYISGSDLDAIRAIALDDAGDIFAAGVTLSTDLPTKNAFQPTSGGGPDAWVLKMKSDGSALYWSTYYGGTLTDDAGSIAVDGAGAVYVGGDARTAPDLPLKDSFRPSDGMGVRVDFLAKFSPTGDLVYATLLGGTSNEYDGAVGLDVDADGTAYVAGQTAEPLGGQTPHPTTFGAYQREPDGGFDVYVMKISTPGPFADMIVDKWEEPDPVATGAPLSFWLNVTNRGPDLAKGVTLFDAFSAPATFVFANSTRGECAAAGASVVCLLGDMRSGESAVVQIVVLPGEAGDFVNTARVASHTMDMIPGNNEAVTETMVVGAPPNGPPNGGGPKLADLALTKEDAPDPVDVGGMLTYWLNVTNLGPATATNVTLEDVLPGGVTFLMATSTHGGCAEAGGVVTCALGSLANGSSASVAVDVRVDTAGELVDLASVAGSQADPDASNNAAFAKTWAVAENEGLPAPGGLVCEARPDDNELRWTAVPGADGYRVLRREGNAGLFVEIGRPNGTTFADDDVTNGVVYQYRVFARAGVVESEEGAMCEVTAIPFFGPGAWALLAAAVASVGAYAFVRWRRRSG